MPRITHENGSLQPGARRHELAVQAADLVASDRERIGVPARAVWRRPYSTGTSTASGAHHVLQLGADPAVLRLLRTDVPETALQVLKKSLGPSMEHLDGEDCTGRR